MSNLLSPSPSPPPPSFLPYFSHTTSLPPFLFLSLSPLFPLCLPFRLLQVEGDIAELIQDFRYESEDLLLREGAAEGGQ